MASRYAWFDSFSRARQVYAGQHERAIQLPGIEIGPQGHRGQQPETARQLRHVFPAESALPFRTVVLDLGAFWWSDGARHGRLGKVHNPGFALTLYQGKTVGLLREQGRCGDFMLPHGIRPPDHGVCRACGSPANAVHPTRHAYPRGGMYHPQWPGNLTQLWHLWGRFGVFEGSERAKE
jgi:hypothetical protein